jgi:hypothetical protein
VGLRLDDAFARMTFLHGFLHADPHPGERAGGLPSPASLPLFTAASLGPALAAVRPRRSG